MHEALLEGNARAEEARLGVAVPNWRVALHGLTGAAGALSAAFTLATAAALWLGGSATEALWLLVPLTATHWLEAGVLLVYNAGGCSRCTRDGTQQVRAPMCTSSGPCASRPSWQATHCTSCAACAALLGSV